VRQQRLGQVPAPLRDRVIVGPGRGPGQVLLGFLSFIWEATAVLLSIAASVKRRRVDPWVSSTHVRTELPKRPVGADLADRLPDGGRACPAAEGRPVTSCPPMVGRRRGTWPARPATSSPRPACSSPCTGRSAGRGPRGTRPAGPSAGGPSAPRTP